MICTAYAGMNLVCAAHAGIAGEVDLTCSADAGTDGGLELHDDAQHASLLAWSEPLPQQGEPAGWSLHWDEAPGAPAEPSYLSWLVDDDCTDGAALLSDAAIQQALRAHVTPKYCDMIRRIQGQLDALQREGVVRLEASTESGSNCVWGFRVLEVLHPLRFNQAFRAIVPPTRGSKPLARPTEVFMKTLRFCGVTARRGSRGPPETDPGPRDFLYSYFYDFVADKEAHNRRKLCVNGYCPELRKAVLAKRTPDEYIDGPVLKRSKCA